MTSWLLHISQDGPVEPSVQQLVDAARDERISYSPTGHAVGAPRNKTRLLSDGRAPYVTLLDHDDVWEPDFLRRRVEFLEAHPECGFVFSPLTIIDAGGDVVERAPPLLDDGVHASAEIVPALLECSGIPGGSVVVRRSALREVGDGFCDFLPRTYDYEMWIRLALRFPVGYIRSRDVLWRRHSTNASRSDLGSYAAEYTRLVSHLSAMFARAGPEPHPTPAAWRRKLTGLLLMTSMDALSMGDRRTAWRYLARAVRSGRRDALSFRTLAVAARVGLGRPGSALVDLAVRGRRGSTA